MNPDLEHLIVLQAQDLELARLRGELAEAPRRVSAAEAALRQAQRTLADSKARLLTEEKLRRGHESDIAGHRTKLDRLRRSLDGATSAQQVTAFEREIVFAQEAIARLEEEEFASMERTEALEAEEAAAQRAVGSAEVALVAERERAASLTLSHEAAVTGIEGERTALRAQITPQWLATYDRLAKTRGTAVAEALGTTTVGKCAACQMGVRPQRWQDLIGRDHLDEIFNCESCGRLLFWDPRRDTPRAWAAGERLTAATHGATPATGGVRGAR